MKYYVERLQLNYISHIVKCFDMRIVCVCVQCVCVCGMLRLAVHYSGQYYLISSSHFPTQ